MNGSYVSNGALELLLKDILSKIRPLEEDYAIRVHIIDEFRSVVQSIEGLRGATVEPFGSFVSNLYSRWGDLDISIEVSNDASVSSLKKKRKQSFLRDIYRALQRIGIARNLKFISRARVPLLMFESNHQNISCDISIGNLLGQVKSKLFFWITELDERFRDMVLLVKEWAKAHNINDSKAGTLNSYSLSLLVIFHFQTCEPALLPPLMEIYEGNISDDLTGVRGFAERHILDACIANIERFRSDRSRTVNQSSLSGLFVSFFEKFSRINTMASEFVICTYTGQWEPKRSNSRWMAKTYPILVEDPFEQPENAARSVGVDKLIRISEAFEGTHHRLLSANQDQSSLIANLVRPQIRSHFVARTTQEHRSAYGRSGGSLGRRPQFIGAVPFNLQNSFQNMQLNSSPSTGSSQRSRLRPRVQSQSQQMWRPRLPDL